MIGRLSWTAPLFSVARTCPGKYWKFPVSPGQVLAYVELTQIILCMQLQARAGDKSVARVSTARGYARIQILSWDKVLSGRLQLFDRRLADKHAVGLQHHTGVAISKNRCQRSEFKTEPLH